MRRPASPVFIPLAMAPTVGGALRSFTNGPSEGGRDWVQASTASAPSNCVFSPSPTLTRARSAPMRSSQPTRSAAMVAQARDTAGGIIPPAHRSMYEAARSTSLTAMTMPPDMYVLGVCRSSGCFSRTMTEAPWSAAAIAHAAPAPPKPTTTMSASSRRKRTHADCLTLR